MSVKKHPSKERVKAIKRTLRRVQDELSRDPELLLAISQDVEVCLKCGNLELEEVIDQDKEGNIWCCSECPEIEEHH